MKKIVLAVLGFGGMLLTTGALAQGSFTLQHEHVKYTLVGYGEIHSNITNNTPSNLQVSWRVLSHDFPNDWKEATGICDNVTCYISGVLGSGTAPGNSNKTMPFSGVLDFKLQMNLENAQSGTHNLYVEITDSNATTDTVHFEINKWPASVNRASKSDNNITIYPNPARSELNVLFDANAGIRNIAVYNLIGKAVTVYRVSGNSAMLDIDNIPSGIYFLRFVDGNGRVIATRKFTHQ